MTQDYKTISDFYQNGAPEALVKTCSSAQKDDIFDPDYPYAERMKKKDYNAQMDELQVQLVKMLTDVRSTGKRIAVIFEGRDAAGKGGTIKRVRENLNPRYVRDVALAKPNEIERTQWYFQRYIQHLPAAGNISLFDRSWYNRGVIEPVFGFCTQEERDEFFAQAPKFEQMLVEDNIIFIKFWLTVSRAEQLRRFLDRENDPLKQWKLSPIDIQSLTKWDDYTAAIDLMLSKTHTSFAPWTVLRSDDKKRLRLEVIKHILRQIDYQGKDDALLKADEKIFKAVNI